MESLKRNLHRHKSEEQQYGFEWTSWQAEKLRNMENFRKENAKIVEEYSPVIDEETAQLMQEQFSEGEKNVDDILYDADIPKAENAPSFFGVNEKKMTALMEDITTIEQKCETAALRMTDDIYRTVLNRVQLAMAGASAISLEKAIDDAVKEFLERGINCIQYADGRRVNIADYVRMALRTTSTRAKLQGASKRWLELGYDTVVTSQYGGCSETCLEWQGRVYINDVFTTWTGEVDGDMGKSNYCGKWFPLLSVAIKGGLFHPNCRHTLSMWKDGVNTLPEPIPADKIKKQRELEQKQRRMENNIRKLKRLVAGTENPDTVRAYKKKLKDETAKLRQLVAENGKVLKRNYSRENMYGNGVEKDGLIKNQAKSLDVFNDRELPENSSINAEQITEDLKQTKTGQEALETLENLPEQMKLTYEPRNDGVRGYEENGETKIYLDNCKDIKTAACSVIHECTHYKYGIGGCQWAESVCVAKEIMHRRDREYLTISEKRNIIKAVKDVYGEYKWKKGGTRYGRSIQRHK